MAANQRAILAGKAFIEFSLNDKKFNRQLKSFQKKIGNISRKIARIGKISFAAGAGIMSAFVFPVKLAADLESTIAEFDVLTGSAEEAKRIISEIEQFSKISLIPVKTLQDGARTLLGYGVEAENLIPVVKALTEISRGSADRMKRLSLAFGQTHAKTRLYAQEVRQFVEAGLNPLQQIAQRTGETMKEVQARMSAGAISAEEVSQALIDATRSGGRFHGLLDKMSKTFTGLFAKVKASVLLAIRPIGTALLPLLRTLLRIVVQAIPAIEAFTRANGNLFIAIAVAGTALTIFGAAMTALAVVLGMVKMGVALLAGAISAMLSPLGLIIKGFTTATTLLLKHAGAVELLGKRFIVLKDIATESFGIIIRAMTSGEFAAAANLLWASLKLAWLEGTKEIRSIFIATWGAMVGLAVKAYGKIERGWSHTAEFIMTFMDTTAATFKKAWNSTAAFFEIVWLRIKGIFVDTRDEIAKINEELAKTNRQIDIDVAGRAASRNASAQAERDASMDFEKDVLKEVLKDTVGNLGGARQELKDARAAWMAAKLAAEKSIESSEAEEKEGAALSASKNFTGGGSNVVTAGIFNGAAISSLAGGLGGDGILNATERTADAVEELVRKEGVAFT